MYAGWVKTGVFDPIINAVPFRKNEIGMTEKDQKEIESKIKN